MRNFYCYLLFISLSFHSLSAQNPQQSLEKILQEYHSIPREVAYLHLNKTVLLQGEQLGFSAYVVNKSNLKPSKESTNLYVQVRNSAGEVVKEKLLLVQNGVAFNNIKVDTAFASGDYVITAFTNWMRNFEEQNYFTESFRVISSNLDHIEQKEDVEPDVQFLPESGHLLSGAINTVGVVVKDKAGYGLSNATVVIKDGSKLIHRINLNRFGIGRFTLIPEKGKKYSAVLSYQGKEIPMAFNTPVVSEGIILSAVQRNKELRLLVSTNAITLSKIENAPYFLVVQNRGLVEAHELKFENKESIPVIFNLDYLAPGINIFTLFDEHRRPIAERLFFNYEALPLQDMQEPQMVKVQDSLEVRIPMNGKYESRMSISILPQKTLSHNSNHNILSYTMLQPYLRGVVEDAGWYFQEITEEKIFELDKLLITQGWSSYDWNSIFQGDHDLPYKFEKNIELTANINKGSNKDQLRYLVHANANNQPLFLDIPPGKDAFVFDGFQPVEGEELIISRIKDNDKLLPAGLAVQFSPQKIPYVRFPSKLLLPRSGNYSITGNILQPVLPFEGQAEELGEVLLETTVDKLKERERKLGEHSYGQVHVIKDNDVALYQTLAGYLRSKNIPVSEAGGIFEIGELRPGDFPGSGSESESNDVAEASPMANWKRAPTDGQTPIYLDGMRMMDYNMFYQYPLSSIDYIEINKMGSGLTGGSIINIYSLLKSRYPSRDRNRIQQFDIPLAYSCQKRFYVPKYENENDSFFESYGVIDWKPGLSSEGGEDITFRIKKPGVDFQMIIEGFTTDGILIYDVKTVSAGE